MISIIIPYYFGESVVRRSLLSCAPGRDIGAQIILAFDSPEDEEAIEIKHWVRERAGRDLPEVLILQNETNIGPVATRRVALQKADREFVILCDQDDELTPVRFEPHAISGYELTLFETLRIEKQHIVRETHPHHLKRLDLVPSPVWNQLLATRRQPARMGAVTMSRGLAGRALSNKDGGGEEWEFFISAMACRPRVRYDARIGIRRHVHDENLSIVKKKERLETWLARVETLNLSPLVRHAARKTILNRAERSR